MATSLLIRESTVKPGLQTTSVEWLYQCYKQLFPSLKSKIFSAIHSLLRGHLFKYTTFFCLLRSLLTLVQLHFLSSVFQDTQIWFALFNDNWSQCGHTMSYVIILFLNMQCNISDMRLYIKAVSLMNALMIIYGHFNLPQGFMWVCTS